MKQRKMGSFLLTCGSRLQRLMDPWTRLDMKSALPIDSLWNKDVLFKSESKTCTRRFLFLNC